VVSLEVPPDPFSSLPLVRHTLFAGAHRNTLWVARLHQPVHQPPATTVNNEQPYTAEFGL
jgi:hypothetical protein